MSRNRSFRGFVRSTGWGLSRPVCRGRFPSNSFGNVARNEPVLRHGGRAHRNTAAAAQRLFATRFFMVLGFRVIACLVVSRCSVFPVGGTDRSAISKERSPIHIRSTGTAPSAVEHPARSRNASAASYLEPCVRPCRRKRAFGRFLRHETGVPNLPSHRRFQVAR